MPSFSKKKTSIILLVVEVLIQAAPCALSFTQQHEIPTKQFERHEKWWVLNISLNVLNGNHFELNAAAIIHGMLCAKPRQHTQHTTHKKRVAVEKLLLQCTYITKSKRICRHPKRTYRSSKCQPKRRHVSLHHQIWTLIFIPLRRLFPFVLLLLLLMLVLLLLIFFSSLTSRSLAVH